MHDSGSRLVFLFFSQIIGVSLSIYVRDKTKSECFICLCKLIISCRVKYDTKTVYDRISVIFYNTKHLIERIVEYLVLIF